MKMIDRLDPESIPNETVAIVNWLLDFTSDSSEELSICCYGLREDVGRKIYESATVVEACYCPEQVGSYFKTDDGMFFFLSLKTARRSKWADNIRTKNPTLYRCLQSLSVFIQ